MTEHHPTYTEPITFWSHCGTDVYSQADSSHIASCDGGMVGPGVEMAALIAAAPELLEALQDCLALMVNGPDGCDDDPIRIETAARAAIAKATGGAA